MKLKKKLNIEPQQKEDSLFNFDTQMRILSISLVGVQIIKVHI